MRATDWLCWLAETCKGPADGALVHPFEALVATGRRCPTLARRRWPARLVRRAVGECAGERQRRVPAGERRVGGRRVRRGVQAGRECRRRRGGRPDSVRGRDSRPDRRTDRDLGRRRGSRSCGGHPCRRRGRSTGLTSLVGGEGGILGDFVEAFGAIDGLLLGVALLVVLVILLVVYRAPVLPLVVLLSAVLGLGVASAAIYGLASSDLLDLNGQSQGMLFILAMGAATDYSLLIVARFREELRDHESQYEAMRSAYRGALEPIVASGLTVILGLLCLLLSDLSSLKGLGPVGALGIAGAMLSSLTLLPAALLLLGRKAFWPYPPRYGSEHRDSKGIWGRVARLVGRRARIAWVLSLIILAACAAFVPTLNEDPVPQTELFLTEVDSVGAQGILDEHFDSDQSSPAIMLVPANRLAQAIEVAQASDGVADNGVASLPAGPPSGDGPPSRR